MDNIKLNDSLDENGSPRTDLPESSAAGPIPCHRMHLDASEEELCPIVPDKKARTIPSRFMTKNSSSERASSSTSTHASEKTGQEPEHPLEIHGYVDAGAYGRNVSTGIVCRSTHDTMHTSEERGTERNMW